MKTSGFTLIEVLIAVFIVGLALISSLRALDSLAQAAVNVEQRTLALWSADNLLLEYRLEKRVPELGKSNKDCPQGSYKFVCVLDISPTPNPGFYRVVVSVYLVDSKVKLAQIFHITPKMGFGA